MFEIDAQARHCLTCVQWQGVRVIEEGGFICGLLASPGRCALLEKSTYANEPGCAAWVQLEGTVPRKKNCWEENGCEFEEGGRNAKLFGVCPAYPDHGQSCYEQAETQCRVTCKGKAPNFIQAVGKRSCNHCDFYKRRMLEKT